MPAAAKHAHGAELPMFPSRTAVFGAADLIEELGADRVLLTLATIPTRIACTAEQVTALAQLGERYKQRAAMRMAPTDSNSPEISGLDSGSSRPH